MQRYVCGAWLVFAVALLAVALITGCAGKKPKPEVAFWEYGMPEGKTLEYQKSEEVKQTMEVMGQPMEMGFYKNMGFSIAPKGREKNIYQIEVTVNSMDAGASTPQGDFTADTEPTIGKSFHMSLSYLGKEVAVSGADEIMYGLGPQGERSIGPDFAAFFPDLPGRPIKIGDTWTSQDTIPASEGGAELLVISENLNTLEGFETINGMKCVKVTAVVTGSLTGEGEQMGAPLTFSGTMEGTETWYFAHEDGIFVKSSARIATTASVEVGGPQQMTIPMTMNMTMETELIK